MMYVKSVQAVVGMQMKLAQKFDTVHLQTTKAKLQNLGQKWKPTQKWIKKKMDVFRSLNKLNNLHNFPCG